jgi:hypothetical protein
MKTEEAQIEELARRLAANGAGHLDRHQRALERARGILLRSELDMLTTPGSPLYEWEHGPLPVGNARRIYTAATEDGATGEGMTVSFMATLAGSEVECRRRLAAWLGPHLAHGADIEALADRLPRYGGMFVAPGLNAMLEDADRRGFSNFSHFAQHHENWS